MGGERSALYPGHFTPGERAPIIHRIGGWVGTRTGLAVVAKRKNSCPCQELNESSRQSSHYTD